MTTKELQTIKNADPEKVPFDKGIFKEMQRYIGEKTDGFSDVNGLDSKKIDMTSDITNAGKSVDDFKEKYGSTKYSEQDIASYIAGVISGDKKLPKDETEPTPPKPEPPKSDKDRARAMALLKLAQAKIAIAKAQNAKKKK